MGFIQQIILIVGLCLTLGIFEAIVPAEKKQPLRERLRNVLLTLIFLLAGGGVTVFLVSIVPLDLPTPTQRGLISTIFFALVAIFVWDSIFYWYHRAEHTFGPLWAIHKLHHSDAHLNATSSLRHSWLEHPLQTFLISTPAAYLLHLDTIGIFVFTATSTAWLFFVHANWKLQMGFFTPIIGGPQVHRIHHSLLLEHRNKNFSVFFPFIDKIFGTYYAPALDEFPPTGANDLPTQVPWHLSLAQPFLSWIKMPLSPTGKQNSKTI